MDRSYQFDLRQEADYALGLMDLYPGDWDLPGILRKKGLTELQVKEVLFFVKREGYSKRLRQSKKILMIGLMITAASYIPFLLWGDGIKSVENDPDVMASIDGKMILWPLRGFLFFGIAQSLFGIYRYLKYKDKIRNLS
jgi:hypothetical protein